MPPGLYVQDGGQLSSSLGSILGNIATQVGPEAAAKAALLSQQTQGADLDNEDKWNKIVSGSNLDIPGLTRSLNMNATDPGNPSVAGTVTSLAVPPSTRGPGGRLATIPDESGYTPEQKYLFNEALNGRLGSEALKGDVDTFATPLVGTGMTPGAVRTRSTQPLSPGQRVDVSGVGAGPYETGGSPYAETVDKTTGASNPAALESDIRGGQVADANFGKAQQALAIFDQYVAPSADPAGVLSEEAVRRLSDATGIRFTRLTNADAKAQIKQYFLGMVGSMRDTQGNPLPRGALEYIVNQFPDPDADPVRFHSMANALLTSLDQQRRDGQAAFDAYRAKTPDAYLQYLRQKGVNAEAARRAFEQAGLDIRQGQEEPKPRPAESRLQPADQATVARARVKLTQAHNDPAFRQQIIDAGKANGVDLEAGGF
jgi:hypothetical protein